MLYKPLPAHQKKYFAIVCCRQMLVLIFRVGFLGLNKLLIKNEKYREKQQKMSKPQQGLIEHVC